MICAICKRPEPTPQVLIDARVGASWINPRQKYLCREHGRVRAYYLYWQHKKRMKTK